MGDTKDNAINNKLKELAYLGIEHNSAWLRPKSLKFWA